MEQLLHRNLYCLRPKLLYRLRYPTAPSPPQVQMLLQLLRPSRLQLQLLLHTQLLLSQQHLLHPSSRLLLLTQMLLGQQHLL